MNLLLLAFGKPIVGLFAGTAMVLFPVKMDEARVMRAELEQLEGLEQKRVQPPQLRRRAVPLEKQAPKVEKAAPALEKKD